MTTHEEENLIAQRDNAMTQLSKVESSLKSFMAQSRDFTQKEVEAAKGPLTDMILKLQKDLVEANKLIEILGGTELGQKMRRDRERARLQGIIDEATKARDALEKEHE